MNTSRLYDEMLIARPDQDLDISKISLEMIVQFPPITALRQRNEKSRMQKQEQQKELQKSQKSKKRKKKKRNKK